MPTTKYRTALALTLIFMAGGTGLILTVLGMAGFFKSASEILF